MKEILEQHKFNVQLKGPYSEPDRKRDVQLLKNMTSTDAATRGKAVLAFVYSVRCNTLHGSKQFDAVQQEVLKPSIVVVHRLIRLLRWRQESAAGCYCHVTGSRQTRERNETIHATGATGGATGVDDLRFTYDFKASRDNGDRFKSYRRNSQI